MKANRRQQDRRVPEALVFFQLEGDDGGKVLNISEGGLCFESFGAVPQSRLVHFWFSLDLKSRIEATGRLAWTDATRKIGGLSFIEMSRKTRERIGAWMMQNGMEERPRVEQAATAIPSIEALVERFIKPDAVKAPKFRLLPTNVRLIENPVSPEEIAIPAAVIPQGTVTRETLNGLQLVPVEKYRSATRDYFIRGVILGILISLAAGIPVFKYSKGGTQRGAVAATGGSAAPGNSGAEDGSQGPSSGAKTVGDPVVLSTAGKPQASKPVGYAPDNPALPTMARPRVHSQESSTGSRVAQPPAQSSTEESKRTRKSSATPQQLWSSVQGGSTKAMVALADLYIRGEGVPVNCDQARVLLLVASEKNSAEAIKKLHDLDKTGCPPGAP